MQYVKYGNAGIEVSRVCLGGMTYANTLEEQEAITLTRRCVDLGCNFIDTADSYRGSEELLGKALQGIRDQVIVSTKVWASTYTGERRRADCSRRNLLNALHASLRKLQTDYVDIYMCHHPDPLTPFEETYSTLNDFVRQGKVRYIGMCNAYAWQVTYALGLCARHGWEPPVSVQVSYNLLDRIAEIETLPMARRFNLMLQSYGPQARGLLAGKFTRQTGFTDELCAKMNPVMRARCNERIFGVVDVLEQIRGKYGLTLGQLATCWVLARDPHFIPIVGGSRAEHLEPLMACSEIVLETEDVERLNEASAEYIYLPWMNQPNANAPAVGQNRV